MSTHLLISSQQTHTKICLTSSTLMITLATFLICLFLSLPLQHYLYFNGKEMSSGCLRSLNAQNLPELSSPLWVAASCRSSHGLTQLESDFIFYTPPQLVIRWACQTSSHHSLPPDCPMLGEPCSSFYASQFPQGFPKTLSRTFHNYCLYKSSLLDFWPLALLFFMPSVTISYIRYLFTWKTI